MLDGQGRIIDYMRISVTDRCDLRCIYCMPEEGIPALKHDEILHYEEIIRLARIFAKLGIKKIRLTGGEPLVRKDLHTLVAALKEIDGIHEVVLTSNGTLLAEQLPDLVKAGISGVNISLDAIDDEIFELITRRKGVQKVLRSIDAALAYKNLKVKINCVPSVFNETQILPLTRLIVGEKKTVLRFIEQMPIGAGEIDNGINEARLKAMLEAEFGSLSPVSNVGGTRNCRYFSFPDMAGKVGFISAVSHKFCDDCNRVRLTADGFLKTCLQFDSGVSLKELLNSGSSDAAIQAAIEKAITEKPICHSFSESSPISNRETRIMSQIGG